MKARLDAVDGLRGIAAIAVALMHAHIAWTPVMRGYLSVDFFFVLSGFVIARTYEPRFERGLSVGAYMRQRIERLYPLLLLGSVLGVATWAMGLSQFHETGRADVVHALVGQFTMLPFLSSATGLAFDAALWSISFEILANLAHAVLHPRLDRRVLMGLIVAGALGLVFMGHRFGSLDLGWATNSALGGLARVGYGFFLGVALYRTEWRWRDRTPRVPFLFVGALLLALVNAPIPRHGAWNLSTAYDLGVVLLAMPALVMLGTRAKGGRGAAFLGALSFPIYALHVPIVDAMRLAGWSTGLRLACVVLLALAAWAIGRYVDEPLNAWRRQQRGREQAAPVRRRRIVAAG